MLKLKEPIFSNRWKISRRNGIPFKSFFLTFLDYSFQRLVFLFGGLKGKDFGYFYLHTILNPEFLFLFISENHYKSPSCYSNVSALRECMVLGGFDFFFFFLHTDVNVNSQNHYHRYSPL